MIKQSPLQCAVQINRTLDALKDSEIVDFEISFIKKATETSIRSAFDFPVRESDVREYVRRLEKLFNVWVYSDPLNSKISFEKRNEHFSRP